MSDVPILNSPQRTDPVCGHCGKRLSAHFHENEIYCFETTTGDVYTDEPSSDHIGSFVEHRHPELYAQLVTEWKRENGHLPNIQDQQRARS